MSAGYIIPYLFPGNQIKSPTARPDPSSVFAGWSPSICAEEYITMPESDLTCTAIFNMRPSHRLTVNTAGTGNGTVSGGGTYAEYARLPITAKSDANSVFKGWSPSVCADELPVMPESDLTCTATFNKVYTLTQKGTGPDGELFWNYDRPYEPGKIVQLEDLSSFYGDFYLKYWSPAPCAREFVMPESDLTCTATLDPLYTLTVSAIVSGDEDGAVEVSGGGKYKQGTRVSPMATVKNRYGFDKNRLKLTGWGPPMCAETFNMPGSNVSCTAKFEKTYYLRVTPVNTWTGYPPSSLGQANVIGEGYYLPGEVVTAQVKPYKGSRICAGGYDWKSPICGGPFPMPENDVECTVCVDKKIDLELEETEKGIHVQGVCVIPFLGLFLEPKREYGTEGTSFMALQSDNGTGTMMFKNPLISVSVNISDYSGDTTLTAYNADDAVLKSIPVRGETAQSYTIEDVGDILKVVVSSSDASVEYVIFTTALVLGDINFDGDSDLKDTILMLQVLAEGDYFETIYPELSISGTQITLEDAVFTLQKVAELR